MPTVKQHLAAIRQVSDYLTTGGVKSALTPNFAIVLVAPNPGDPRG
jgi:hypothetical protein